MPTTNTFEFTNTATTTLVTTAETAVLTMTGISTRGPSDQVGIEGQVQITPGTAATGARIRVRRGNGLTGAVVGSIQDIPVTAAVLNSAPFSVVDTPGEVAGQAYTVTVVQTAATANGSVTYASGAITLP